MPRVLLVGYDPETVDYSSPALPPGMNAEKIRNGLEITLKEMTTRMGGRSLLDPPRSEGRRDRRAPPGFSRLCLRRSRRWRPPASTKSCVV